MAKVIEKNIWQEPEKKFAFKDKMTIAICVAVISVAVTVIVSKAAGPSATIDKNLLLVTGPGQVAGALMTGAVTDVSLLTSSTTSSTTIGCGSAARTYSCSEKAFTGALCANGSVLSSETPNFPTTEKGVIWRCAGPMGEVTCIAKKEIAKCSTAMVDKTVMLTGRDVKSLFYGYYNQRTLAELSADSYFSKLCSSGVLKISAVNAGLAYGVIGSSTLSTTSIECMTVSYSCLCKDGSVGVGTTGCSVRYCNGQLNTDIKGKALRYCGDGKLDADLGEECEAPNLLTKGDGLFGHTCAERGLCGTMKCDSNCKLDTSGCMECKNIEVYPETVD